MLLKENSLFGASRGLSVASKKMNVSGLRNIEPKFFKGIANQRPSSIKKNDYPSTITILKKQNLAPEITSVEEPTQNKQKNEGSIIKIKRQDKSSIKIYPRGLHNIGNTCYMNSTLQCLFHLKHFSKILLNQINKWPCNQKLVPPVASETALALKEMLSKQGSPLNLGNLKKNLGKKKPMFLGNAQQDAQQYLTSLLQILNEELTRVTKKNKYKELQGDPNKKQIPDLSDEWWNYYMEIDNSIICDAFQGQTISTIKCKKCGKVSVNFDNIWGLPVTFHKNMSLHNLLINNWKSEILVDDYYCSTCKQLRNCTKVTQLYRLPQYLVIQLKRFQYERGQKKKRKEQIKIDKQLNLDKLLNQHAKKGSESIYRLKGVVHHYGQAEYGHYYAQVFCDALNRWYNINDSSVDQIDFSEVSKTAYLLFYEQIG